MDTEKVFMYCRKKIIIKINNITLFTLQLVNLKGLCIDYPCT